jgi:NAD+ synthase (glutamine-hydrolysing)
MRVALAQINPVVGDLEGNSSRILAAARAAADGGAQLVVYPELALCGYPPRDLVERDDFVDAGLGALHELARRAPPEVGLLVGFVEPGPGPRRQNAAALLRAGRLEVVARKRLLPTYDVFDEARWFEPGTDPGLFTLAGLRFGVTICEDAWNDVEGPFRRPYTANPVADCVAAGADVLVNISASPFTLPKRTERARMMAGIARNHDRPLVFVNQVGANDELIFDGSSALHGPDGACWASAASFAEDLVVADLAPGGPAAPRPDTDPAAALDALRLGLADYARKTGFTAAVLGLSGGIDSALTAAIAASALGPAAVLGVAMPSRFSSDGSVRDARDLAANLGIEFRIIPIDDLFQHYLDELTPHLQELGEAPAADTTFENLQARIRGQVLMAISNRLGHLLLTTGNKSELAVGYSTLYGDMAGGLAVLADLPKTLVYHVAREVNRRAEKPLIPVGSLTKPPSAELRADQTDQDSLPPYDVLDAILERYVEDGRPAEAIVADGFDDATVRRVIALVRGAEYKRRQMPPGLILTRKAFGPGRRYPIAHRWPG